MQEQINSIEEQQRVSIQLHQDQLSLIKSHSDESGRECKFLAESTLQLNNSDNQMPKVEVVKQDSKSIQIQSHFEKEYCDRPFVHSDFEVELSSIDSEKIEEIEQISAVQVNGKPKKIDTELLKQIVQSEMDAEEIEIIHHEKIEEHSRINQIKLLEKNVTVEKIRLQEELDRIRRERIYEEHRIQLEAQRLEELRSVEQIIVISYHF